MQKSKIFQLVAPFQLEVGNSWRVLGDFVRAKDFGAIATFFVASYLMNNVARDVRGSPVVFDPIEAAIDGATQAADELQNNQTPARAAFKFFGRVVGEILGNVPVGQTLASAIRDKDVEYITGQLGSPIATKAELFGKGDPGRFGSGLLSINSLRDPLYRLLPPFGGVQAEKTVGGIKSLLDGQVTTASGDTAFKQGFNAHALVSAFLFGKNATPEAQQAYAQNDALFNKVNRQAASRTEDNLQAEDLWGQVKKLRDTQGPEAAAAKMQEVENTDPALADKVATIAEDEQNGLTQSQRLIKMLGVENGERAKYIVEHVQALKTPEEKAAFLQALDDRKLISDQVFDQIQALMGNPQPAPEQQ